MSVPKYYHLKLYGSWGLVALCAGILAFRFHGATVFLGLWWVNNVGITGWNSNTIYAVSRLAYFIFGCAWLFLMMTTAELLRDWLRRGQWQRQMVKLLGAMMTLYFLCGGTTWLMSRG